MTPLPPDVAAAAEDRRLEWLTQEHYVRGIGPDSNFVVCFEVDQDRIVISSESGDICVSRSSLSRLAGVLAGLDAMMFAVGLVR